MKNIKTLTEFITEKKVTIKRKYTDMYPAKYASTSAKVRNVILDAIGDGVITEEEMDKILSEIQAHKRWKSRNFNLFKVIKEDGVRKIMLSNKGKKIKKLTLDSTLTESVLKISGHPYNIWNDKDIQKKLKNIKFKIDGDYKGVMTLRGDTNELDKVRDVFGMSESLNEALNVPYKEKGKKPVNIFVGRFQPFTLGHVKVFEQIYKENGLPIVVFLVRGKKSNPKKNPFSADIQQSMFAKMVNQYSFLEASYVIPNAGIDTIFSTARPTYEPILWGYGTDRKKPYDYMINKPEYREHLGVNPEFKGFEIKRNDNDISASKVRQAIKNDDESTFKKMTPKSIHSFYKTLQTELHQITENKNGHLMKNLKSLNEFTDQLKNKNLK